MKNINPNPFTTRPEIDGTFGVVASTHWIATAVGMGDPGARRQRLRRRGRHRLHAAGGRAASERPGRRRAGHPLRRAKRASREVICGQGPAPAGATIAHYRELGPRHGAGHRPARRLRARHVRHLDAAAARLRHDAARRRAGAGDRLRAATAIRWSSAPAPPSRTVAELFREHWPTSAAVYLPGGKVPSTGTLFTNQALADDLRARPARRPRAPAATASRRSSGAQGLVAGLRRRGDRPLLPHAGGDGRQRHAAQRACSPARTWRRWQATRRGAAHLRLRPLHACCKAGPWSQGPVLLQQLALLKGFDLDGAGPGRRRTSSTLVVECAKLAYADREAFYGDPDFVDVPMATLLSDAYNAERRKLVGDKASLELRPGSVEGFGGGGQAARARTAQRRAVGGHAAPASRPSAAWARCVGDTVHFDIIDQAGNMVSATPSGGWLQSSPVIPELGFCLGTRGADVLAGGGPCRRRSRPASGRAPRCRRRMALRDGEPYLAWGTPGGDQQDQWITQLFLRHVHAGMNLQEAIDAPAWHTEHFPISFWPRTARPGVLVVEGRLPKATRQGARRGAATWSRSTPTGRRAASPPPSQDGRRRQAAANPRGMQGYAAGR